MKSQDFVKSGVLAGYPSCCIIAFIKQFKLGAQPERSKFWGTGFVPCEACKKKSEGDLIAEINSLRIIPTPFENTIELNWVIRTMNELDETPMTQEGWGRVATILRILEQEDE